MFMAAWKSGQEPGNCVGDIFIEDRRQLSTIGDPSNNDQGKASVVARCNTGEKVWVRNSQIYTHSFTTNGIRSTWFCGILIHPDLP